MLGRHKFLPTLRLAAVSTEQELSDLLFVCHNILDLMVRTPKLELVAKLWHPVVDQMFGRDVLVEYFEVRSADGENMRHKVRVPLGYTEDYSATPIVSSDDDPVDAKLFANSCNCVCVSLKGEVP